MVKIAFFDIDGTLINFGSTELSPKTKNALMKLKNNGVKIFIATGRGPSAIPKFEDVEFDGYITFNGAYCFSSDDVICQEIIPSKDVVNIINNAKKYNHPVVLANTEKIGANGTEPDLQEYFNIARQTINVVDDFEDLKNNNIYQIMIACRKNEYDNILKDVDGATITAWWDKAVDIIPKNCNKGYAIEKILAYYSFDKSEAIAFGDGRNDIEMLRAVGCGIAMGNATETVKCIADKITDSVANDGIYSYLNSAGII